MMKTLKLLPEEMVPFAKTRAKIFPPPPAFLMQMPRAPFLTCALSAAVDRFPRSERILLRRNTSSASAPRTTEAPLIYAVDDVPDLTELYTTVLEATGYLVRAFNDRAEALAALKADRTKPDLLITDYLGLSMPVDRFIQRCLAVHPTLRILMASGLNQTDTRVSHVIPGRFIQKPFTLEELQQEVRAALTA